METCKAKGRAGPEESPVPKKKHTPASGKKASNANLDLRKINQSIST